MCQIDERYLINVADYQPVLLPKPRKKTIDGVPLISVESGEDDRYGF